MTYNDQLAPTAFIGFGEAAKAFAAGWGENRPTELRAYDIKSDMAEARDTLHADYAQHHVIGAANVSEALRGARVVFCVVTADQALAAAGAAAPHLEADTLWLDCNSCSPGTKRAAAEVIHAAGGRYVDVAVMPPVYPKRHHVPVLVSGPNAEAGDAALRALDMKPRVVGENVGRASSIKMLRSVMIKGFEALTAECFLSARRAGVEEEVIGSLEASDPDIMWRQRGSYNLERMMVHGGRRASEMEEVARTVQELGLGGGMSAASSQWQSLIAGLKANPGEDDLYRRADEVLSHLKK